MAAVPAMQAAEFDGSTRENWPHYGGTRAAWRYSALDQINGGNVARLVPAWIFQTGDYTDGFQVTPIVVNGVMYISTNNNHVIALDAATGEQRWRYQYQGQATSGFWVQFQHHNRGVAVANGRVYFGTYDNYLLALDTETGRELWKVNVDNAAQCGCMIRAAPLVAKGRVIVGGTGGDGAHRGYITAFDAETGRLAWRFYVIPGPGEKGHETWKGESWKYGGGAPWITGSFDPDLGLTYWGTGNAAPDFYSGDRVVSPRPPDADVNLYTASIVALDVDTGKLRWYHQEIPNDVWDYDAAYEIVLFDREIEGRLRKLLVHMNKSGVTFLLDRESGEVLNTFIVPEETNWISGVTRDGKLIGRREPKVGEMRNFCPSGFFGAKSWNQMAYSPLTHWIYTPTLEICMDIESLRQNPVEGRFFAGGSGKVSLPPGRENYSHIDAIDPITGERKWSYPYRYVLLSSILATGGNLVFVGDPEGHFFALDAGTGEVLWRYQTGAGHRGSAVTYAVKGRQYVATPTGWGSIIGGMAAGLFPGAGENWRPGSTLVVFALPGAN